MTTATRARIAHTSTCGRVVVEVEGRADYALLLDGFYTGSYRTSAAAEHAGGCWLHEQAAQLAADLADEAAAKDEENEMSETRTRLPREIKWDAEAHDFRMTLDDVFVGYAPSYGDAEQLLDEREEALFNDATLGQAEQAMTDAAGEALAARGVDVAALAAEGLRLADDDEAGWTYRRPGDYSLWVTDAPARAGETDPAAVAEQMLDEARANQGLREWNARCQAEQAPASDDAALAAQLLGELNELEDQATAAAIGGQRYPGELKSIMAAYDAKSARIRSLGYDIGPAGDGALALWPGDGRPPLPPVVTIDTPGLNHAAIVATPGAAVAIVERQIGSYAYSGLLVAERFHPLIQVAHLVCNPAAAAALAEAAARVQVACGVR